MKNKKWITTGVLAKVSDVSTRTVCKWCDSGKLPHVKIPGSSDRRIRIDDALDFLLKNKMPGYLLGICFFTKLD